MKILRPQPSSVLKERCRWWGKEGIWVLFFCSYGATLCIFSFHCEWSEMWSRRGEDCSENAAFTSRCAQREQRGFFCAYIFCRHQSTTRLCKKKKHTAHTCVIFLCSRSDVTVTLIQSNQKTLVEIILVCRCYFRYMLVWLSPMQAGGGTIGMSHFSQFNLCCLSSDSFIFCPLSHSVSYWFPLSASGPHEYLASSHARSARYALTFRCLILVSKKGFNQKVNFLPPSSPRTGTKISIVV